MGVKPCVGKGRGERHRQDPCQTPSSGQKKGHCRWANSVPCHSTVHSIPEEIEEGPSSALGSGPGPWGPSPGPSSRASRLPHSNHTTWGSQKYSLVMFVACLNKASWGSPGNV